MTSQGETWSRGTNSRLPFDVDMMLDLSTVSKAQPQDENRLESTHTFPLPWGQLIWIPLFCGR